MILLPCIVFCLFAIAGINTIHAQLVNTEDELIQELDILDRDEKYYMGLRLIEQFLEKHPDSKPVKIYHCTFLHNTDSSLDSIELCLNDASNLEPTNLTTMLNYGVLYYKQQDYKNSQQQFQKILEKYPYNIRAKSLLYTVSLVLDSNDTDSFLKLKELAIKTHDVQALSNAIKFLNDQDKFVDADRLLKIAEEIDPKNPDILTHRGVWYAKQGEKENAERYFLLSLDEEPEDITTLNNLALLYRDKGDEFKKIEYYEKSISYYNSVLTLDKENPWVKDGIDHAMIKISDIKNEELFFNLGLVSIGVLASGIVAVISLYFQLQKDKKNSKDERNKDEQEKLFNKILTSKISIVLLIATFGIPMSIVAITLIYRINIIEDGDVSNWVSMVVEVGIGITVAFLILVYELTKNDKFQEQQKKIKEIVDKMGTEQTNISGVIKDVKQFEINQDLRESKKVETENRFYKLNLLRNIQSLINPIRLAINQRWRMEGEDFSFAKHPENVQRYLEDYGYWADRITNINSNVYVPPEIRDDVSLLIHQAIKPISFLDQVFVEDFLERTVFDCVLRILDSDYIKKDSEPEVIRRRLEIIGQMDAMNTSREQFRQTYKS